MQKVSRITPFHGINFALCTRKKENGNFLQKRKTSHPNQSIFLTPQTNLPKKVHSNLKQFSLNQYPKLENSLNFISHIV
jgi:hypothetical protein